MCGQFCAAMYGYGASGYRSALVQWTATPDALRRPGDANAPAGALLYWDGGNGHVAVADGFGSCWSIDISGPGTVTLVPASMISARWSKPYLGWAFPYFQGAAWSPVMINGVDVSRYQAVSGWEIGIDFAFVKVTEGTTYVNPSWVAQRDTARAAELVVGYYHFARPGDMITQADFFLSKIALQPGDVLMFDWEDIGVSSSQKDAWISYVQGKTGHRVIMYCNKYFWINRDTSGFAGDGLFIATADLPAGFPGIQSNWLIHQFSTAGNLDHDVAQFASRADMITWAGGVDVALTPDDKTWIKNTIVAAIKAEAFAAVLSKDAVRSPTDDPANPTWAAASYLRESYLRLLEILAEEKGARTVLSSILSQSQTNGSNGTAANMKLDSIMLTLDAIDLSRLPAEIAAKLETLKFIITEG